MSRLLAITEASRWVLRLEAARQAQAEMLALFILTPQNAKEALD